MFNLPFSSLQEQLSVLKHERDLLEIHLDSEIKNSNQLNRDVEALRTTKRELLQHIDHLETKHIEEIRNILEKTNRT